MLLFLFISKKFKETDQENSLSKCNSDQDQPSKKFVVIKLNYFLK
jgi:hypothetical protein